MRYFGGWGTNAEEFFAAIGEFNATPTGFVDATFNGRDGDFNVYQSRHVIVAPIATRKRWITNNGSKGRSHLQMLCMLAFNDGGNFTKWGPVVLSAKGLTTREIESAMRQFDTSTAEIRKDNAPGVPTLYFWHSLGTFGKAPKFETVGSGNASSTVTYPTLYTPEEITAKHLQSWFVGNDIAGEMVHLRNEAAEWLNDKQWKQGQENTESVDPYFANGFVDSDDVPF